MALDGSSRRENKLLLKLGSCSKDFKTCNTRTSGSGNTERLEYFLNFGTEANLLKDPCIVEMSSAISAVDNSVVDWILDPEIFKTSTKIENLKNN